MQGYGSAPPVPIIASVFGGVAAFALVLAVLCAVCRRRRLPRTLDRFSRSSVAASDLLKQERGWYASSSLQQSQGDGRNGRLALSGTDRERGFLALPAPPASTALADESANLESSVCSRASSATNQLYYDASSGFSTCGSVGGSSR